MRILGIKYILALIFRKIIVFVKNIEMTCQWIQLLMEITRICYYFYENRYMKNENRKI